MTKRSIKVVYTKETQGEPLPANGIDLDELTSTNGDNYFAFSNIFFSSTSSEQESI